jgi:ABC-type multidrug transport system fused ATPase/permease subunit
MGLFKIFSRKQDKNKENMEAGTVPSENKKEVKRSIKLNTQTERVGYIKDNCESILECNRQMEEAKAEYQLVTSYLTDMQKIDMIPLEERETLEDAARMIINLTKERNQLKSKSSILTDRQYRLFEQNELQIPKDMPLIREKEQYQAVIQQDIKHLEKERKSLDNELEEIISKQAFLKGIAVTISIIVILLFIIFAVLSSYSETDFSVPFLLTVLMGMALAFYIFMEARKNNSGIRLNQIKQNRQIMLMNKVKIKSVNNRNYLEYSYSKYMVESYEQLKIFWEEYVKVKEESKRYMQNTELLEFYNKQMMTELKKFAVTDSEIWIYQPTAILDSKEMVEVRHRLNVRRQKLRERIDENTKQKTEALNAIKSTTKNYPECAEEAGRILRRYRIEVDE